MSVGESVTVYAHPNPKSFCHAVLEQFTTGLRDTGHSVEVVDLYAIGFDPVFRQRDMATYLHEDIPAEILESMNLRGQLLENVPGGPVGRFVASRWLRDKTPQQITKFIREHAPRDAREQWRKVEAADGLAFIAPVFWLHFPAILKVWFEAQFGNTQCRTPTGCDFATAQGVHTYIEHDGTTECAHIARLVAERVADLIAQATQAPANGTPTRRRLGAR